MKLAMSACLAGATLVVRIASSSDHTPESPANT